MALPHQLSERAASTSVRATRGFEPSLFSRSEKAPCVRESNWVVWPRHSDHSSDVAHSEVSSTMPPRNEANDSHARMGICLLEGTPVLRFRCPNRNDTEGFGGGQLPFAWTGALRHAPSRRQRHR